MKCFLLPFIIVFFSCTSWAQNSTNGQISNQEQVEVTTILLEVRNLANQTIIEKGQIKDALSKLRTKEVRRVSVSDGRATVTYTMKPEIGEVIIESSRNRYSATSKDNDAEIAEFQFDAVDEVPIFPGCEDLNSEEKRKKCTIEKVQEFVKNNFDREVQEKIDFPGMYKAYVQFRVNPDGSIQTFNINAPHPAISEEMKSVLSKLPRMVPGQNSDMVVPVLYSFPFVVYVDL